jgi:hypothetical protein
LELVELVPLALQRKDFAHKEAVIVSSIQLHLLAVAVEGHGPLITEQTAQVVDLEVVLGVQFLVV